jgi:hypothetical protein
MVCGTFEDDIFRAYRYLRVPSADSNTTSFLRKLWKNECLPNIQNIYLIDSQGLDVSDKATCEAYVRRNISANISEAIPHRSIAAGDI